MLRGMRRALLAVLVSVFALLGQSSLTAPWVQAAGAQHSGMIHQAWHTAAVPLGAGRAFHVAVVGKAGATAVAAFPNGSLSNVTGEVPLSELPFDEHRSLYVSEAIFVAVGDIYHGLVEIRMTDAAGSTESQWTNRPLTVMALQPDIHVVSPALGHYLLDDVDARILLEVEGEPGLTVHAEIQTPERAHQVAGWYSTESGVYRIWVAPYHVGRFALAPTELTVVARDGAGNERRLDTGILIEIDATFPAVRIVPDLPDEMIAGDGWYDTHPVFELLAARPRDPIHFEVRNPEGDLVDGAVLNGHRLSILGAAHAGPHTVTAWTDARYKATYAYGVGPAPEHAPELTGELSITADELITPKGGVVLSGSADPFALLTITGGAETVTTRVAQDGQFRIPLAIAVMEEGELTCVLTMTATNAAGLTVQESITVVADNRPPTIVLNLPDQIDSSPYRLSFTSDEPLRWAAVEIQGTTGPIDWAYFDPADGLSYGADMPLAEPGRYALVFYLWDMAFNPVELGVHVHYVSSVPWLTVEQPAAPVTAGNSVLLTGQATPGAGLQAKVGDEGAFAPVGLVGLDGTFEVPVLLPTENGEYKVDLLATDLDTGGYTVASVTVVLNLPDDGPPPGGDEEEPVDPTPPGDDEEEPVVPTPPGDDEEPVDPTPPGDDEEPVDPTPPGDDEEEPVDPTPPSDDEEEPVDPTPPGDDEEEPVDPTPPSDDEEEPVDPTRPGDDEEEPVDPTPPGDDEEEPVDPTPPGDDEEEPVDPTPPGDDEEEPVAPTPPGDDEEEPVDPTPPGDDEEEPVDPAPPGSGGVKPGTPALPGYDEGIPPPAPVQPTTPVPSSGNPAPPQPASPSPSTVQQFTSGQSLTVTWETVSVILPAYTFTTSAQVKVGAADMEFIPLRGYQLVAAAEVTATGANGQAAQQRGPLMIIFGYDADELGAVDSTALKVFYWHVALESWIPLPTEIDQVSGTATATVEHLTLFALMLNTGEGVHLGELPHVTHQPRLAVNGTARAGSQITVARGGQVAATGRADTQGHFRLFVTLEAGMNRLNVLSDYQGQRQASGENTVIHAPATGFLDIRTHWAREGVERMVALGIARGYSDEHFGPDDPVTRAMFMTFLLRALGYDELHQPLNFVDSAEAPTWAAGWIAQAVELGLVGGYEDGTVRANASITRAEMAALVERALKIVPANETAEAPSFADAAAIPAWAEGAVQRVSALGLIRGYADSSFGPDRMATRAEALVVIQRLLDLR